MKKIFTTLFFLYSICGSFAQTFPVDTIYKTGSQDNRINVVILGDGFTEAEMPKFKAEAAKFADFFLSYAPYDIYKSYFNFFSISTPSKESGADNPGTAPDVYKDQPIGDKNTFYNATFGSSIHRLVTIDYTMVFNVLSTNLPQYDLAVVLVNTKFYGGSGGSIAVHTLHELADLIGAHEIGHTFAHLNDEYWAGVGYGWESPNMSADNNPATIRWRNWLNSNGIGIHKHGTDSEASKWFKPTESSCLMQLLNQQFCAVCREATTEMILSLVNPVERVEPDAEGIIAVGTGKEFKLDLVKPEPNSLHVEWMLNNKPFASGPDHVTVTGDDVGDYATLTATVFDSTLLSRRDSTREQRSWKTEWNLESNAPKVFRVRPSADSVCVGREVRLTATGCPGAVSWSTGENGNSITFRPSQTSTYEATCKVEGKKDSIIKSTISVLPPPDATASNTGPYFVGSTIEVNGKGGIGYSWKGPGDFSAHTQIALIPNATISQAGQYEVTVTDLNGCSAIATTEVKVDPILAVVNEPNEWVQVSPNPAKEYVKVKTKLPGESAFTIYDMTGKKRAVTLFEKETEIKLDFPIGMYLYRFTNGKKEVSGKILVNR
ncbi:M64 family metallopeptidase [Dyadobacter arcticus]|uniref:Secretion system C-terminal sorting domain-containing protein n=1 Tax=Dyadobacter arcticus TaxID=1078754 RepID=A0ABX0ULY6_9BACT|nr:M64 family metallopeptidase [Dyadobacter arcticus]NIJ54008.1 hypothetical protein [Dyadobacter arcticus]